MVPTIFVTPWTFAGRWRMWTYSLSSWVTETLILIGMALTSFTRSLKGIRYRFSQKPSVCLWEWSRPVLLSVDRWGGNRVLRTKPIEKKEKEKNNLQGKMKNNFFRKSIQGNAVYAVCMSSKISQKISVTRRSSFPEISTCQAKSIECEIPIFRCIYYHTCRHITM